MFLGSPRLEYDGKLIELGRRKALALLCYLAVNEWPSSREVLAGMLWPECDDKRARAGLRQALASLNETPLVEWLETDRDMISLRRDNRLWIDVSRFNELLAAAPTQETLSEAVAIYRDNFMAGFTLRDSAEFDNWQSIQTQVFQQKLISALEQLVALQIAAQETEKAIQSVRRWLIIDVLHEPAQRQFMRLCAATGQRAAALRQFETYSELLREELGIVPSAEMVRLYEAVKKNEPILLEEKLSPLHSTLPALPRVVVGREESLNDLKRRLLAPVGPTQSAMTVIQGWPGIGKTTLVAMLAHDAGLHEHFADGVLFVSLGKTPNLFSELMNWAQALGITDVHKLDTLEALSQRLAAVLRDKHVLIIVDDVWEASHAVPFDVGGYGCARVITTRMNDVAQKLADKPENIYKIPILTEAKAVELLHTLAPQVVEQNEVESFELIQALEGLPLAIQVAGRLLNAEMSLGWGVNDLLRELREGVALLDAEVPSDRVETGDNVLPTVRVLLKRSTDWLDLENRKRFALLGVFAPKPATFDLEAMKAVWRIADPRPTVRTLVARGLLEPVNAGRFQVHALLVMHARSMFSE
jgi:DNA-binding SARP family transcriptional activator